MIPTKRLNKQQAKSFVEGIDKLSDAAFEDLVAGWKLNNVEDVSEEYIILRAKIINAYNEAAEEKDNYMIDLKVGLALYKEFNPANGFSIVMASDDDIWRYLSCKVFPDITYARYPKPEKEVHELGGHLNHKRFYSHTRRIWLKTLWWYIFLSWQGTEEETFEVLKHLGTDAISQFIERTGRGYRLKLYRQLMYSYSLADNKSSELFKKIQKLNLVNCRTIEPALVKNAEKGYVETLFKQLSINTEEC